MHDDEQRAGARRGPACARSALLVALAATGLAACGGPPPIAPQGPRPVYLDADLAELIERANAWTAASLRAEGELRMYWSGTEDSRHVNARLFAARSGALRLDGSRGLVGQIFDLVADGLDFQLVVPDHAAIYTGGATLPAEPDPERPYFSLRPHHITEALLPEILPAAASPDSYVVLETYPDRYALVWMDADGGAPRIRRRVWIERVALRVERVDGFDRDGRIDFIATYSEYLEPGTAAYPGVIEVERPWEELVFRFDLENAERDPTINPRAFLFRTLPPGYRTLTIEEAMAEFRRVGGD